VTAPAQPTTTAQHRPPAWKRLSGSEHFAGWAFVAPAVVLIAVFMLIPIVWSLLLSLQANDLLAPGHYIGLANYKALAKDSQFRSAIGHTIVYTVLFVPVSIVGALALAVALDRKIRGIRFYRLAVFIPLVTSTVATGILFLWLLDPTFGLVNYILHELGLPQQKFLQDPNQALYCIVAMTLGDRIAVLSDGKLQQLGDPQEIYDKPANVFVAGFIGSPSMNLLRGSARDGRVSAGEFTVSRAGVPDGDVVVGLRPEALRPPVDGMPSLDFHVDVVEPLGDELIVHGSLAAELVAVSAEELEGAALVHGNSTGVEAVACLHPRNRPAEGSVIRLGVEPEEVYVFDARTGDAIR
jgi:hypothetical protein